MAEMAFLVMSEILGLSFNKFPGDDYSLRESENLPQPIQMKLPKKIYFPNILLKFSNIHEIFNILRKKVTLIAYVFWK